MAGGGEAPPVAGGGLPGHRGEPGLQPPREGQGSLPGPERRCALDITIVILSILVVVVVVVVVAVVVVVVVVLLNVL